MSFPIFLAQVYEVQLLYIPLKSNVLSIKQLNLIMFYQLIS